MYFEAASHRFGSLAHDTEPEPLPVPLLRGGADGADGIKAPAVIFHRKLNPPGRTAKLTRT